jgi:YVTN family beta-propeller protein
MKYASVLLAVGCLLSAVHAQWLETTVPVGDYPTLLCYNSRENKVYCAYLEGDSVTVIDGATNQVIAEIAVGPEVTGLCYNPAANKVYCSYWNDGVVTVMCGDGDTVIAQVPVQVCRGPMCCDSAGNKVYCAGDTGDVTVICGAGDSVLRVIHASGEAMSMAYGPDHRKAYAGFDYYDQQDTVFVIDCVTDSIVAAVPVYDGPGNLFYNPVSGCVLCPAGYQTALTVIDCATNQAESTDIPYGLGPMCCVPAENKIFSLSWQRVVVLDATSHTVVDSLDPDDSYIALLYDPVGSKVLCASLDSNRVAVLDPATNHVLKTIAVGSMPRALCHNPVQNRVYVANTEGASVSVIRDSMPAAMHEGPGPQAGSRKPAATVLSGASGVRLFASSVVFDAMGRRVMDPRSGVFFVRERSAASGEPSAVSVRKVVITR